MWVLGGLKVTRLMDEGASEASREAFVSPGTHFRCLKSCAEINTLPYIRPLGRHKYPTEASPSLHAATDRVLVRRCMSL